jgi:leucyl aminopeptidase (aminopeptidase T)
LITNTIRDIFRINLGVKKHERVLIFTDKSHKNVTTDESANEKGMKLEYLCLLFAEIGKHFCKSVILHEYPSTGGHGIEPPKSLWECAFGEKAVEILRKEHLLNPLIKKVAKDIDIQRAENIIRKYQKRAVHCVIALSYYSTSHTRFRDFLTRICGCRYASMPLFDISMLEGAMRVNWKNLAKRTKSIAHLVNKAEHITIRTPNGTSLSLSTKGRRSVADTGILTRQGSFGNLPAGEVFIAPLEETAHGKLVLEWTPTRQCKSPITLLVKEGFVRDISGKDEYTTYLRMKIAERRENGNIAELGIGTNDSAKRPDNILETEKILGTIHVALGDNSSFGGKIKTPFHQDFVFFKPTVTLTHKDGSKKDILRAGRLLYEI